MPKREAILYTREGCHLCDTACEILVAHGLTVKKVDIDTDSELKNKYDTIIPVVEIDGTIRFRGRVDALLLRRLLRNKD
jgi:glutaredoxin